MRVFLNFSGVSCTSARHPSLAPDSEVMYMSIAFPVATELRDRERRSAVDDTIEREAWRMSEGGISPDTADTARANSVCDFI